MGLKHQAFKARLSPMVIGGRAFTYPQLGGIPTPLTPQASGEPELSSPATETCAHSPDWCTDCITETQSIAEAEPDNTQNNTESVVESAEDDTNVRQSKRRNRGRRGGIWQPPALPNHSLDRPCEHNSWDNVRVKKEKSTLRCRVCQLQWKIDHALLVKELRCQEFHAHGKCAHGDNCGMIHVHRCKQNLESRQAIWGENLLVAKLCTECEDQPSPSAAQAAPCPLSVTQESWVSDAPPTLQTHTLSGDSAGSCYPCPLPTPSLRQQSDSSLSPGGRGVARRYSHNPYDFQQPSEAVQSDCSYSHNPYDFQQPTEKSESSLPALLSPESTAVHCVQDTSPKVCGQYTPANSVGSVGVVNHLAASPLCSSGCVGMHDRRVSVVSCGGGSGGVYDRRMSCGSVSSMGSSAMPAACVVVARIESYPSSATLPVPPQWTPAAAVLPHMTQAAPSTPSTVSSAWTPGSGSGGSMSSVSLPSPLTSFQSAPDLHQTPPGGYLPPQGGECAGYQLPRYSGGVESYPSSATLPVTESSGSSALRGSGSDEDDVKNICKFLDEAVEGCTAGTSWADDWEE